MTPASTEIPGTKLAELPVAVRALFFFGTLFSFFISLKLMGNALHTLTNTHLHEILQRFVSSPVLGLLLGIITTSIIQSSSATTAIVVALAASPEGGLELRAAIPIVMGANIGTTITNTLVSFTHVRRKKEFERAMAAGTVHDWFNILATAVLFPIEISTHFLENSAIWIKESLIKTSFGKVGGLKTLVEPIVDGVEEFLHYPGVVLLVGVITLMISLTLMVKIMRSIFIQKMARIMDRFLFRNGLVALFLGIVFTVLVQSSSVTTSLIVPLVGAGILTLEQVFPYTMGANIGTTVTAFLAALALAAGKEGNPDVPQAVQNAAGIGVTVAVVHLLFNIFGIMVIYPFKAVPIGLARWVGRIMTGSKKTALVFMLLYFLAPLTGLGIIMLL